MGRQKALLTINGKSFVRHLVDIFHRASVTQTVVVVGSGREAFVEHMSGTDVLVAVNERFEEGQLSSIVAGINAIEAFHPDAILVHPVDHPLISGALVDSIIAAFTETSAPVVLPVFKRRRGHPVLFSAAVFAELKSASPDVGARSVVWSHAAEVREVETNEEGVILDVDTPEDYTRLQKITGDAANS
jgi:molybdenum cofactor cytidylyltransferase